jgi:DNA-binding transcriptional LysR family regulator
LSQIDLRLIRAAVAVAEELSFSRAALKLHISQPALTKQIQDLEATLRIPLFIRRPHGVQLTDAGRAFVEESKLALLHQQRAVQVAKSVAKGAEAVLTLGQSPFVDPLLTSVVTSIHLPLFPDLRIAVSSDNEPELLRRVASSELDVALVSAGPSMPQLTQVEVATSPLYVLTSETSSLAIKRSLMLRDLDEIPWILFARQIQPMLYDSIEARAGASGAAATERHYVTSAEQAAQLVYRIGGAAILNKHGAWRVAMDGLTIRPLDESEILLRTVLAVRSDSSRVVSELVRATVRKLRQLNTPKQRSLPLAV